MTNREKAPIGINEENLGLGVQAALRLRGWLEIYIREPQPDEIQKAARRNRWLAGATAVIGLTTLGVLSYLPDISDYLRNRGIFDSTTPIKSGTFYFPASFSSGNPDRRGDNLVDLSGSNQVADGGRSVIINTAPGSFGLSVRINKGVLAQLSSSKGLGTALEKDQILYTLLVPFSLKASDKTAVNRFLQAEADLIEESNQLRNSNRAARHLQGESDTLTIPLDTKKAITPISLTDTLFEDVGSSLGTNFKTATTLVSLFPAGLSGGGLTEMDNLGNALNTRYLKSVITANPNTKLDLKNLPLELTRFIENNPAITVTQYDKSRFDREWLKTKKLLPPKPTPKPTIEPPAYLDESEECFVTILRTPDQKTTPVDFAVGVNYKHPEKRRNVRAAQWDFNGDGIWDTPLSWDQYTSQSRILPPSPKTPVITARVQFTDGGQTKPCSATVTLNK